MSDSTSRLLAHPSLEQLRKQAKELLRLFRLGDTAAVERFRAQKPSSTAPILADAQFVLARECGYESWPKLVHHLESMQPSDRMKQFERLAMDFVQAYRGDSDALDRLNSRLSRLLTPDQFREFVQQRLNAVHNSRTEIAELTLTDAQLLIARQHGFENWSKFVSSFIQPPGDPRSLPHGMSPTPPFYRIDWKNNTIAPGPLASQRDWDAILDVIKELQITGVSAEGQMTDEALERLSRLSHLTHLSLGGMKFLTDSGLKHLARMPQLQELDLSEYPGGRITDQGLECLRHLPELRRFQMAWQSGITDAGVANLAFCDQLESVDLLGTYTGDGAINALGGKNRLRSLKTGRLVTDDGIELLHRLPMFETWQDWEAKYNLMAFESEPTHLLIDGPFTCKGLAKLEGLEGLFGLSFFWHTSKLKGDDLKSLVGLPHLGFLGCQGELCDDDAMRHIAAIPGLRMLMGQGTVATDDGFVSLSRSQTIEYIWGRECPNLKGRGFAALAAMPSLRGIAVSCKHVDDVALSTLPRFPALTELLPMDVTDHGFRHVGHCQQLESLILMYCRETTDVATEHIAGLSKLKRYYAGGTQITDRSLGLLGQMPSLEHLEFDSCAGITDAGVALLAGLPQLREISIEGSPNVTREGMVIFPATVRVNYK